MNPSRFGKAGREGAHLMTSGNGDRILHFEEIRRVHRRDHEIVTFQILLQAKTVGYLFLTPDDYTLAWNGHSRFSFEQPFFLNELVFSHLTVAEIKVVQHYLPKKKRTMDHFYYADSKSLLVIGSENREIEFDLLDGYQQNVYMEQWVHNARIAAGINFVRYESQIVIKNQSYDCCFTAENTNKNEHWEFTLSFPRNLLPKTRAFKWIARNHQLETEMRKMDFEESRSALSKILNPQTDSVVVFD